MIRGFQEYLGRYMAMTDEEQQLFARMVELRSYAKKVRVTEIGEVEQSLSFVAKGLVRKYFIKGREEIIKHISVEGTLVSSHVSFFSRLPSAYVIETLEPTVLLSISFENLEKLFQASPRWERVGRLMVADLLIEKEYWLLDSIRYTPRERFLRFVESQPDLIQRVPQKFLASYLDIKPETFSRLKHLVKIKTNPIA